MTRTAGFTAAVHDGAEERNPSPAGEAARPPASMPPPTMGMKNVHRFGRCWIAKVASMQPSTMGLKNVTIHPKKNWIISITKRWRKTLRSTNRSKEDQ